jgi:hypothetical protein
MRGFFWLPYHTNVAHLRTRKAGLSSWAYKVCFSYYTISLRSAWETPRELSTSHEEFGAVHVYIHTYTYTCTYSFTDPSSAPVGTSRIECWIHRSSSILWSSLCIAQKEILISFNTVSLYTKVPLRKALYLLSQSYDEDWQLLDLSSFPMVVNVFIKDWEDGNWLGVYVHDTIIWLHGPQKMMAFLDHLNSIHKNISQTGRQRWVPFLPSHWHPPEILHLSGSQRFVRNSSTLTLNWTCPLSPPPFGGGGYAVVLVCRVRNLCNQGCLHDKLQFLKATFIQNGYSN